MSAIKDWAVTAFAEVGFVKFSVVVFCAMTIAGLLSLCCSSSVLFGHNPSCVRQSLTFTFRFWTIFFFADEVMPYFGYYSIITRLLFFKHQTGLLRLKTLLLNWLPWFVLFGSLKSHFTDHLYESLLNKTYTTLTYKLGSVQAKPHSPDLKRRTSDWH